MNLAQMAKWEKIRIKGSQKYILVNWGLRGGILATLIFEILKPMEKGFEFSWYLSSGFLREFITAFIAFTIIGIVIGKFQWSQMEKKYKTSIQEEESKSKKSKKGRR